MFSHFLVKCEMENNLMEFVVEYTKGVKLTVTFNI